MLRVALDRHDVDRLRLVRVDVDRKAEVGRQVAADLVPGVAGVVAAHHVPVLLHEQHVRPRGVHGDAVHAVADLGVRIGDLLRAQAAVDRLPGRAAVVGAERAGGRDRDEHALRIDRVEQDRVQAHAARARLPLRARAVAAQAGQLVPARPAVGRAEQRRVFDAGVDGVGIGERRLEVPDALELPRVRRAVVPLVRARARRRRRTRCRPAPSVVPPSSERWISCPNQPLVCDA